MFSRYDKKALFIYSGLALLFIYPLIQAGIYYRDDLDRSITGYYGWRGLGRPFADILTRFFSASGHYNLDLFPYTMLASCIFLGASALALSKHLIKSDIPNANMVAALLIFNPFILQNIAYRYDSLGMSIAFFLTVVAYTYKNKNLTIEVATKLIAGVLSLTLYQPCANIFIGLLAIDVIIIATKKDVKVKESIIFLFKKTILFVSFFLIYMLFFSPKNNSRAELIHLDQEGLEHLAKTLIALKEMVLSYLYHPVYIYFAIPILISCVFMLIAYRNNIKQIASFILYGAVSFLIFIISLMGPTLLLQDAPVLPRTLVSFSVILVIIAIPIMRFAPRFKYAALIPVIASLAFSAQLSNAMKSQQEYEDFVFSMIAQDIATHKDIVSIGTVGQLNKNERARLLIDNKPLIGHFVFPATEFLASYQLVNKGFTQTLHGYGDEQENKNKLSDIIKKGIKPVSSNEYYTLFISDNNAIVFLGKYSN
ncbi:TPA: glucosyltransferase domain-containing protein [Citrobacter braakii]|uniref:Glucosyltransferase domain-containing protein n=1 Tax=Citrobacter braakii TaxID=57706 RepID=A0A1V8P448_CITBR|nr:MULTISPECIES: glucosyltransferase domain-containing protein [Citrobacter]MBS6003309.1 glucosyltransferase domain-containing protein [Citrobacter sp.]MDM3454616.1 glucosyltransferase domain-containing protein [Citrobacter sp. Cb028]MEB0940464.1 glucosyltransferase domain-containing protein [Citrobacter braakii]MEB0945451.1 glucosyltransferase domain-containing protein [Citrobacter braakii]MEB0970481.1 glucosyltransferase domain-containing protein [Citrobacter braakii]